MQLVAVNCGWPSWLSSSSLLFIFWVDQAGGIPAASDLLWSFTRHYRIRPHADDGDVVYTCVSAARSARWGRDVAWLRFHIFTGLVGPYMVLLHTSWKFNGLAGIFMLLTVVIVLSGIIGRYIYTASPVRPMALRSNLPLWSSNWERLRKISSTGWQRRPDLAPVVDRRLKQFLLCAGKLF